MYAPINHEFYQASDVRRQIREAPSERRGRAGYPKFHGNFERNPLNAEPPLLEHPVAPTPGPGQRPSNYRHGVPGPSRLIYNRDERDRGDVIYHDQSRPANGPQTGEHPGHHSVWQHTTLDQLIQNPALAAGDERARIGFEDCEGRNLTVAVGISLCVT